MSPERPLRRRPPARPLAPARRPRLRQESNRLPGVRHRRRVRPRQKRLTAERAGASLQGSRGSLPPPGRLTNDARPTAMGWRSDEQSNHVVQHRAVGHEGSDWEQHVSTARGAQQPLPVSSGSSAASKGRYAVADFQKGEVMATGSGGKSTGPKGPPLHKAPRPQQTPAKTGGGKGVAQSVVK